jgi:methanogenic corrinoid protein MtbC1
VLACLPGERHCLGLAAFGLALRDLGWRVTYLGADAPLASVSDAADAVRADVVVLAVVLAEVLAGAVADLRALDTGHAIVLGGPATCGEPVAGLALPVLPDDLLIAAHTLALRAAH